MIYNEFFDAFVTLALCASAGYAITYFLCLRDKRFTWKGFILMNIAPIGYIGYLVQIQGKQVLNLFLISIIAGFILEYLLGLVFHKIHKEMLWKYNRYNVHGYTSLLTLPFWGTAGVVFWLLIRAIGM